MPVDETGGPEFWEEISLEAALANLERTGERWDTVVVDEAQDLGANEWSLVETCLAPDARLWIFQDDRQVFWPERKIPESLRQGLVRYELPRAYRNPPGILALVRAYAGEGVDEGTLQRAFEEREVGLVPCHAETLRSGVDKEVRKLLADGFRPEEIAVVSLRGMKLPENIMHEKSLGGCPTARATDPDCQEKLVCDTFLRFKGLERPAVIVTDLDTSVSRYATRAYIACSRALSVLRIVGVRDEMAKDSVLRRFLPP
ncbi:MAG: hypothetical protein KatS3mg076_2202 [Candidatus Binatia bacterium]|nr:MAG: hypothetical protein KatS3mg076_2202 [Candidatus Binatia bacterium]